jgi:hypothetical protein
VLERLAPNLPPHPTPAHTYAVLVSFSLVEGLEGGLPGHRPSLPLAITPLPPSFQAVLVSFSLFEGLLGIYWPAIALLRVDEISDAERASTMAVFRVLLNVLVIAVLLAAGRLPEQALYAVAAAMLLACLGASRVLARPSDARAGARAAKELWPIILAVGGEAAREEGTSTEASPRKGGRSDKDRLLMMASAARGTVR